MKLPDMHRADRLPDWEKIPESEWNEHQKQAAATNGWDTPGNRLTLRGAAESLAGLHLITRESKLAKAAGVVLLGLGRRDDLEDGKEADRTGTKSSLGESFDAGTDSLLVFAAGLALRSNDIVPRREADTLVGLTVTKAASSLGGKALDREMHTSRAGKYGTFAHWSAIGLYSMGSALEAFGADEKAGGVKRVASGVMKVGLALGAASAVGYLKDAFAPDIKAKELLRESLMEVISGESGMQGLQ